MKYKAKADGDLISKDKLIMYLNDWRFGVAPDETVIDVDERAERLAQVDVIDEFMQVVEDMPTVAIPSAEPNTGHLKDFVMWVASEIFDDNWEYNKDAFAEIACRKLNKLGIVKANGDKWELVEPQEGEDKE